jgi:outer membrane lipoprotein carrier protein
MAITSSSSLPRTAFLAATAVCLALAPIGSTGADEPDAGPADDPTSAWLDRARSCLDGVRSLEADFTQEVLHRLGEAPETMQGKLRLRRGGRVRLDYSSPRRLLLVSDGTTVRSWDPESRTVYEGRARDGFLTRVLRFAVDLPVEKGLAAHWLGGAADPDGGGLAVVELRPASPTPLAERIVLTLDGRCPALRRISIIDRAGTATRLTLSNRRTNTGVGAGWFVFTPPKGAEIIRP